MKSLNKKQKMILLVISILLFGIIPLVFSTLFWKKFKVRSFTDVVVLKYGEEFLEQGGDVCYGNIFLCDKVEYSSEQNVDPLVVGEYTVSYHYTSNDKTFTKEQVVKVVDDVAPEIKVLEDHLFYCENKTLGKYKVEAFDNYDGDISEHVTTEFVDGKIKFTVKDTSSNETSIVKDGEMKDVLKPVITLNDGEKIYVSLNTPYEEKGAVAMDNCDGDISDKITIEGAVNTSKVGTYRLKYFVSDSSSNMASVIREVIVYSPETKDVVTKNKNVYLTFDDGPCKYTTELLDILKKYHVKATFFVTNQALTSGYDDVILRAYQEGHTIGLHSNSHDYSIYTNQDTFFSDLYAIQEKVKKITGYTAHIIRFPGGSSNAISKNYDQGTHIMSQLVHEVEKRGFKYYDWNVVSGDAGETKDTNVIVSNVISNLGKFKTTIVLQHDIKDYSIKAVSAILEYGLTHGYEFLPITDETPEIHHHLNN